VPTLPFLVLPLGEVWRAGPAAQRTLVALFVVNLYPQLMGTLVDFNLYMLKINDETKNLFLPEFSPLVGHLQFFLETGKLALADAEFVALGLPPTTGTLFRVAMLVSLGLFGWMLHGRWVRSADA